ncbi:MAG TPA: hypothetical protein VGE24_15110, partial [Emticicia sp.]
TANPNARLTVNGSTYINGFTEINYDLSVNGYFDVDYNANIDGALTVNDYKGVAYNASSSQNLRMFRFTTEYIPVVLGAHGASTTSITFEGGFTSTPMVIVGDIDLSGGTVGELDRVILVLRACSLNSSTGKTTCQGKLINTDDASVNYNVKWNCIAIGY